MQKPRLSVVVVFYNMRREARRTLFSLSSTYQRLIDAGEYEVIAIDSNSTEPLAAEDVTAFGPNFRYCYFETESQSPGPALNYGVKMARGDTVLCLVDGARILSPGILHYSLRAFSAYENAFVYALGFHLGPDLQNVSMKDGYNQRVEDQLLGSVDWRSNGYRLFEVSTLAGSNPRGYFSRSTESTCVALARNSYLDMGGYDERFTQPGGGLVNLDFFNRLQESEELYPVVLLGEGTFHQIHGGVASNRPRDEHPWDTFAEEYLRIKGLPFRTVWKRPDYVGHVPEQCQSIIDKDAAVQ